MMKKKKFIVAVMLVSISTAAAWFMYQSYLEEQRKIAAIKANQRAHGEGKMRLDCDMSKIFILLQECRDDVRYLEPEIPDGQTTNYPTILNCQISFPFFAKMFLCKITYNAPVVG